MQTPMPDIFDFVDCPSFLSQWLAAAKRSKRTTLRQLASDAGFQSPGALSMVKNGQRVLSADAAERLCGAMELTGRRKTYFCALAKVGRARNERDAIAVREELISLRHGCDQRPLEYAQYKFLSCWYYPVLWVMVGMRNFRRDPSWLAKRLGHGITEREVKYALGAMRDLGLIIETDGKLKQTQTALSTSEEVGHVAIRRYHEQMLGLAAASLQLPSSERELNGLTIDIPQRHIPKLVEKIRAFRKEINETFSRYEGAERVYQLNIQLFPVTTPDKEDGV